MKTRTATLGLASIALVGLGAGLAFFSSSPDEARRAERVSVAAPVLASAGARPSAGRPTTGCGASTAEVGATGPGTPGRPDAAPTRGTAVAAPGGRVDPPAVPGSGARGRRPEAPARRGPAPRVKPTAEQLGKLRASLASQDPGERLVAARYISSRVDGKELLLPDLRALMQTETCVPVRRVATQLMAQADPTLSVDMLTRLREDPDAIVRINAAYGLARTGDEVQQAWLLQVFDAAKVGAPRLVPVVAAALEDPAMRSPAVVARFRAIAEDETKDPLQRAKAARVIKSKLGA